MATQSTTQQSLISLFMIQYDQHEYENLAKRTAEICERALLEKNIRHETESRGKETESLRKKIEQRERKKGLYKSLKDIFEDVVDLAGARIILKKWEDRDCVRDIMHELFEVEEERPMKEKSGYEAIHYRVYLKQDMIIWDSSTTGVRPRVEIQVQSIYMAQWAQDEHDSRYKSSRHPSRGLSNNFDLLAQLIQITQKMGQTAREDSARENAEYKQKFSDRKAVGLHLENWISKYAADWVKDKKMKTGSSTALTIFLDARNWSTPESLDLLLEKHLGNGVQDEYSNIAKDYAGIELNIVIYLIDREVLKHNTHAFEVSSDYHEHAYKIRVILSTFIWMKRLFMPALEWQVLFAPLEDREILRHGIAWLGNRARQNLIAQGGKSLTSDEIGKLNSLWHWFCRNHERPIRVAFTMSNQGVIRDLNGENDELENALGPLRRSLS
ncbi:RelA/SpoT [Penicillium nucicola]|uniref:RelA/SpoT n=1 Tax=Penicillium nucicola TaxID=1850975 RepID=UPI002544F492|nr:RelA/SpoT [Penicillium nucicola]KAJ5776241.1 RelA/SpoT [Penicillium nucicola]